MKNSKIDRLLHLIDVGRISLNEQWDEVKFIQTKLHHFSYIWITTIIGLSSIAGYFYEFINLKNLIIFIIFNVIFNYKLFKYFYDAYHNYRGYFIYHFKELDKKDTYFDVLKEEFNMINKIFNRNFDINNERNGNLNKLKKTYLNYLIVNVVYILIMFMFYFLNL